MAVRKQLQSELGPEEEESGGESVCRCMCVCESPLITTELVSLALRKPSGVSMRPQFIMIVSDSFSLCEGNALASAIKELLCMYVFAGALLGWQQS